MFLPCRWLSGRTGPLNVVYSQLFRQTQSGGALATLVSHANVAATSWEDSREGRRSDCAFRRDFNDNVAHVAIFAANNNTSRLLEGKEKSNNSNSARTRTHTHTRLSITLFTNAQKHDIQQHCHAFFFLRYELWALQLAEQRRKKVLVGDETQQKRGETARNKNRIHHQSMLTYTTQAFFSFLSQTVDPA